MANPVASLTDAQREVLRLVMAGYTSKEMAHQLGIGVDAVNKRLASAKDALGAPSRFAAARQLAAYEAQQQGSHSLVGQILAVESDGIQGDRVSQHAAKDYSDEDAPPFQVADIQPAYTVEAVPSAAREPALWRLFATPSRVFLMTVALGALGAVLHRI